VLAILNVGKVQLGWPPFKLANDLTLTYKISVTNRDIFTQQIILKADDVYFHILYCWRHFNLGFVNGEYSIIKGSQKDLGIYIKRK
jgi:hypothetical protein